MIFFIIIAEKNEFRIDSLHDSTIWLNVCVRAVCVANLTQCRVLIGAVTGSFYAINCKDCVFVGAAAQVCVFVFDGCI